MTFQRGRLIRLPVCLRHRMERTWDMVLDTGAPLTVIHPHVAEEIGLDIHEVPGAQVVGVAASAPLSRATVDAVSLLGRTVRRLAVVCHPLNPALGFRGVLGLNFLQHFNIRIDNDSETITFEPRGE